MTRFSCFIAALLAAAALSAACRARAGEPPGAPTAISGVVPRLAMVADHDPRTEAGVGALMPWADRLWAVTYVAHTAETGSGTGLYEITADLTLVKRAESVVGTYANRMVHAPSGQLFIGPHAIATDGTVRTIAGIKDHRLTATCPHLKNPAGMVLVLGMEGEFWEVDVKTLEARLLGDLRQELGLPADAKPHFKAAWTHHGRVVVANNTFTEADARGEPSAGRLAEWDGSTWTVLDRASFTEVFATEEFSKPMICIGNDGRSAILMVHADGRWTKYRLPRHGHAWDQTSTTEWIWIREVETERALMDCYGIFNEVPFNLVRGRLRGLRPVSAHLRVVPDFCSWRGMLVLGGNQATPMRFGPGLDMNPLAGQPQAGLWFGKTDDLWSFGKPAGDGGVWHDTLVKAKEPSDPFLAAGFDHKTLRLRHDSAQEVTFTVEVDFLGDQSWAEYSRVKVPAGGYAPLVFADSYGVEWIRVTADAACRATAHFTYR